MAYSKANHRRRTILMSEYRSQQIAAASAELGISSELFIQSAITAALITAAEHDDALAYTFARQAGVGWEELQAIATLRANRRAKECLVPTAAVN